MTIPDPVTDLDGVRDAQESASGTNPAAEDTDGYTLSDFHGRCYDDDCATYNPGVTDTDAAKADTDNDGMPDGWEIANGLNPLVADTDIDKLSDGDEVNVYGTDTLDGTDTDQDGMITVQDLLLATRAVTGP
jgi:hypothetical protein